MAELEIERFLDAPIDPFFEVMSDHGRYDRLGPISRSELIKEGEPERNGLGAVRKLRAGLVVFQEEITAFERPHRFDYLIQKVNLPLQHDGGSIRFEPSGNGTRVRWMSTFHITVPLLSRPLEAVAMRQLEKAFTEMLEDSAKLATSG